METTRIISSPFIPAVYVETVPAKNNKKRGESSEVFAFKPDDLHAMIHALADSESWTVYLLFVLQNNLARRVGDMLTLTWSDFFTPSGNRRESVRAFAEEKTGKMTSPHINQAAWDSIALYCDKTGCDPSEDGYTKPVFLQLSGTHKGKCLSYDGYRKAIKRAAAAIGIEYNVGTHSARKTFGAVTRELHPNDANTMTLISAHLNHSSEAVTRRYIGQTKKDVDELVDDFGKFFTRYAVGDETFTEVAEKPVISLECADLRDLLRIAFQAGRDGADEADAMSELLNLVDDLKK